MQQKFTATSLEPSRHSDHTFYVESVDVCPICKKGISPLHLHSVFHEDKDYYHIDSHLFCTSCYNSFIAKYICEYSSDYPKLSSTKPQNFKKIEFNKHITTLSPKFIEIYNQAAHAESLNLTEISGIGYRKSLEFLIKDYLIHANPSEEGKIKDLFLGKCIENYISVEKFKDVAKASAWLGNDEAHYVRKHENYNVDDLKEFIEAIVSYVSMELSLEKAAIFTQQK